MGVFSSSTKKNPASSVLIRSIAHPPFGNPGSCAPTYSLIRDHGCGRPSPFRDEARTPPGGRMSSSRARLSRAIRVEMKRPLLRLRLGVKEPLAPVLVRVGNTGHHVLLNHLTCLRDPSHRDHGVTLIGVVARLPPPSDRELESSATCRGGNAAVNQVRHQEND